MIFSFSDAVSLFSIILSVFTIYQATKAEYRMNNIFDKITESLGELKQGLNFSLREQTNLIGQINRNHTKVVNGFLNTLNKKED